MLILSGAFSTHEEVLLKEHVHNFTKYTQAAILMEMFQEKMSNSRLIRSVVNRQLDTVSRHTLFQGCNRVIDK